MFVSLKNKPALTGKTWELQRENHIAKSESLNPEFEQYKNYGDILPQYRQIAADCFTIENTLPANGVSMRHCGCVEDTVGYGSYRDTLGRAIKAMTIFSKITQS